jgi:hypothetical protein
MAEEKYDYNVPVTVDGRSRSDARHGDIFTKDGSRHGRSVIACRDPSTGSMSFLKNPDESGSGYLTIPAKILEPVTDALAKYKVLIDNPSISPTFNLHISPHDIWFLTNLGTDALSQIQDWDFDLHFTAGSLEEVYIKPPHILKPHAFLPPLQWNSIKEFFHYKGLAQCWFSVSVTLDEAALGRYREKYSPHKKYGWLTTKPDLGPMWSLESGGCGVRSGHNHFTWMLEGPLNMMDTAVKQIEEWFEGFDYTIKKGSDKNIAGSDKNIAGSD